MIAVLIGVCFWYKVFSCYGGNILIAESVERDAGARADSVRFYVTAFSAIDPGFTSHRIDTETATRMLMKGKPVRVVENRFRVGDVWRDVTEDRH